MKWLIGIAAVALTALAILAGVAGTKILNGGDTPPRTADTTAARADRYATADQVATPTNPPAPTKYFIGDTVQNGSLRFTVNSTRRETRVYDQFGGYYYAPTGNEYVIVKLTVQNVDTHPVFFYYGSQTIDLHGQQVSVDAGATNALNPAVNPLIQPGLAIPVELAFLVAEGVQPEAIMLSDQLYVISHPLSSAGPGPIPMTVHSSRRQTRSSAELAPLLAQTAGSDIPRFLLSSGSTPLTECAPVSMMVL